MIGIAPRTLYRIVTENPPTDRDFWSHKRRGSFYAPKNEHLAEGISTYDRETDARKIARAYPTTGQLIAELSIPDVPGVRVEKTFGRHHFTVWGEPQLLRSFVVRVITV